MLLGGDARTPSVAKYMSVETCQLSARDGLRNAVGMEGFGVKPCGAIEESMRAACVRVGEEEQQEQTFAVDIGSR